MSHTEADRVAFYKHIEMENYQIAVSAWLASRPEVGVLVRVGGMAYYTMIDGIYKEIPELS